jgi:DHA1 family bicyclomycin/chloramphenicol resistance-like MFS transporter
MTPRFVRNALVLGVASVVGPVAVDMYLPALPLVGRDLHTDTAAVQLSLMAYFLSVAACQVFFGPISDMVGRKGPLFFALGLFVLASIGCALAWNVESLIVFRFIQGIGGCACSVIPRAVVRDLHTGTEAARLMSLLTIVFSLSPILAPLVGSIVIQFGDWRAIFGLMAGVAVLAIVLVAAFLPETRPPHLRLESNLKTALAGYRLLLKDFHFLGITFVGAFGLSGFFAYLASSSFVLIEHYGLSPLVYSLFFSVNAVSFFTLSQFTAPLASRFGLRAVVKTAATVFAAFIAVLFVVTVLGIDRLDVMAVLLFFGFGCLGLVVPATAVLALEDHGAIAGTASALIGTVQFVTGAVVISVGSVLFDGKPLPMVAVIAFCALATFLFAQVTIRGRRTVEMPAE